MSRFPPGSEVSYFIAGHLHLNKMMKRGFHQEHDTLLEALMLYVWILISSSDNQPLLMHSRLRLLLFSPLFYSIGLSLTTLLSVSSHFLQVFLCAFLSFFTSWKGLIPFFWVFGLLFRIPSMPLAFVRGEITNTEGSRIFLLVILWVQALNQPPHNFAST